MPLNLTAEQNELAQTFTDDALRAISSNDYDAFENVINEYIDNRHRWYSDDEYFICNRNAFWEYYSIDDAFVNGESSRYGDRRFFEVLLAALNPTTYSAQQIKIASLLGEFVCVTSTENVHMSNRRQWNHNLLAKLMYTNNDHVWTGGGIWEAPYQRFDLASAFLQQKMSSEGYNLVLEYVLFDSKRCLYNWLLTILACWDMCNAKNRYFATNVVPMKDEWFFISDKEDCDWVKEKLRFLHMLLPSTLTAEERADGYTFSGHDAQSHPHCLPTTALKCKTLLNVIAAELELPTSAEEYIAPLKLRAARVNVYAFLFLSRMLAVIKPRALKNLYNPKNVNIHRDAHGILIGAQGTLTPHVEKQWHMDML
tara:strand:+ start:35 stop:1138 length:1104 start_codon:yes stop_codon:yes gene_type:complete